MRGHGRRPLLAVAVLAPLLLAADDPREDAVGCRSGRRSDRPGLDIVRATGQIIESGMALAFTVTFAQPPPDQGPQEEAWRVDFVLRDPSVPTFSFGPYRDVNRIIRYDHTDPPKGAILLLAEGAISQPTTMILDGPTLRITLAGRLLQIDEDLESLPLEPIRWNVVSRLGPICDRVGTGRANLRLTQGPPPSTIPPATVTPTGPAVEGEGVAVGLVVGVALTVAVGLFLLTMLVLDRRGRGRDRRPGTVSSPDHVSEHQDPPAAR